MISAILLAAGSSTRMGAQDKLFLKYKGHWLVNHVMQQLWASAIDELIIVRKSNEENLLGGMSSERIKLVLNPDAELGMTTSIQAGVKAARQDTRGYLICQADMPLITTAEYNLIIEKFNLEMETNNSCIAVPYYLEKKGNPILISSSYKEAILAHTEMEGCRQIVRDNIDQVVMVNMSTNHVLRDIDTKDDWEQLISKG